jgi:hypothetical protein
MTYLHKFKCLNCRLHFIVFSWKEEIAPVYCPECGIMDNNFHWIEKVDQPIFKYVPGSTSPPGYHTEKTSLVNRIKSLLRFFKHG